MSEETTPVPVPPKGIKAFINEFKEFAVKGNAIDMAVGIIVGGAFNKIVTSLVNDIVMPPLGFILGRVDFKQLQLVIQHAQAATADTPAIAEVAIRYGMFINTIVEFIITALSVFIVIRVATRLSHVRQNPS